MAIQPSDHRALRVATVRVEIRALGLSFRRTDFGEYVVAFPGDRASEYFTPDLEDALDTARAMSAEFIASARRRYNFA